MLKSIKFQINAYRESDPWFLEKTEFGNFNLVAGVNSTGKSRMISIINGLARFIRNNGLKYLGTWNATFEFDNDTYEYSVYSNLGNELTESLLVNGNLLLEREGNHAKLFSETLNEFENFNPPGDSLLLHFRRDQVAYPYLEKLNNWATGVKFFEFGHLHSYQFNTQYSEGRESISIENIAQILVDEVSDAGIKNIISNFNQLGYEIEALKGEYVADTPKILIKERGFTNFIEQRVMSQGMIRSLALLIFIEYIKESGKYSLVLIDDLAEGMDFKRATLLGKYLNDCIDSSLQFISTSNHDYFLNQTNIENWIILHRDGITVEPIYSKKYPDLFRKFSMSGLAPFDMFTSSFLKKYMKDEDINIR